MSRTRFESRPAELEKLMRAQKAIEAAELEKVEAALDRAIEHRRGRLTILDRQGLESVSCECYPLVKKEFARLIGW